MSLLSTLAAARDFIAGFEGDELQQGIPQLLADLRAEIEKAGPPQSYLVAVNYRTRSNCSSVRVSVVACNAVQALALASVAARRALPHLVRIDGGEIVGNPIPIAGASENV